MVLERRLPYQASESPYQLEQSSVSDTRGEINEALTHSIDFTPYFDQYAQSLKKKGWVEVGQGDLSEVQLKVYANRFTQKRFLGQGPKKIGDSKSVRCLQCVTLKVGGGKERVFLGDPSILDFAQFQKLSLTHGKFVCLRTIHL